MRRHKTKPPRRPLPYFRLFVRALTAFTLLAPLVYGYVTWVELSRPALPQYFAVPLPEGGVALDIAWDGTRYLWAAALLGLFGLLGLWALIAFALDRRATSRAKPLQYLIVILISLSSTFCLCLLATAWPLQQRQEELLALPAAKELRLAERGIIVPLALISGDVMPFGSAVKRHMYMNRLARLYLPWNEITSWAVVQKRGHKGQRHYSYEIGLKPEFAAERGLPLTVTLNRGFLRGREQEVLDVVKLRLPVELAVQDELLY